MISVVSHTDLYALVCGFALLTVCLGVALWSLGGDDDGTV